MEHKSFYMKLEQRMKKVPTEKVSDIQVQLAINLSCWRKGGIVLKAIWGSGDQKIFEHKG